MRREGGAGADHEEGLEEEVDGTDEEVHAVQDLLDRVPAHHNPAICGRSKEARLELSAGAFGRAWLGGGAGGRRCGAGRGHALTTRVDEPVIISLLVSEKKIRVIVRKNPVRSGFPALLACEARCFAMLFRSDGAAEAAAATAEPPLRGNKAPPPCASAWQESSTRRATARAAPQFPRALGAIEQGPARRLPRSREPKGAPVQPSASARVRPPMPTMPMELGHFRRDVGQSKVYLMTVPQ